MIPMLYAQCCVLHVACYNRARGCMVHCIWTALQLLHFLHVEPWSEYTFWRETVQRPFEAQVAAATSAPGLGPPLPHLRRD